MNGKMEFFYQFKEGDGSVTVTLAPDTTLGDVVEAFEVFLRAAGYVFNGQLEINGNINSDLQDPNAECN